MTVLKIRERSGSGAANAAGSRGFSLIELMVSVVVLTVVLGAMMQFMSMLQQRYTREQRASGVGQTGKTVMELLSLDIGQSGFYPGRTTTTSANIGTGLQSVVLSPSADGIHIGSKLVVDKNDTSAVAKEEVVEVTAVNYATNTVTATFLKAHTAGASGVRIMLSEIPYPDGVLYRLPDPATISSTADTLRLMGDFWGDRNLRYVEYRFTPDATGRCQGTLVRSDTCVPATSGGCTATNQTAAVTVADNICNPGGEPPGNPNPVFTYNDPYAAPPGSTNPVPLGPFTYVRYVTVHLIMRTQQPVEGPGGGAPRTMVMRQTFVPRNISYALRVSQDGLQEMVPDRPKDGSGNYTVPIAP